MSDLYWVAKRQFRGELTDEVEVEFTSKADDITYQVGTVIVPKRATADEIIALVNARRDELEAEARAAQQPTATTRPEAQLPREIVGTRYDASGVFAR